MSPEEKQLLTKIAQTVEENNEILHNLRRSQRWTTILNWIYWIIIIGSAIGAFWLFQPYLSSIVDTYQTVQNELSSFKNQINSVKSK